MVDNQRQPFLARSESELMDFVGKTTTDPTSLCAVFYFSKTCPHCKEMMPKFEAIASNETTAPTGSTRFAKMDVRDVGRGTASFVTPPEFVPAIVLMSRYAGQIAVFYGTAGLSKMSTELERRSADVH